MQAGSAVINDQILSADLVVEDRFVRAISGADAQLLVLAIRLAGARRRLGIRAVATEHGADEHSLVDIGNSSLTLEIHH